MNFTEVDKGTNMDVQVRNRSGSDQRVFQKQSSPDGDRGGYGDVETQLENTMMQLIVG